MSPPVIREALGLDKIAKLWNAVIHEGLRAFDLPGEGGASNRDWPQILSDVVAELLRCELGADLAGDLKRHINEFNSTTKPLMNQSDIR